MIQAGKLADGESWIRRAVDTDRSTQGYAYQAVLGRFLMRQRRYEEAETELLESHRGLKAGFGEANHETLRAMRVLVNLYNTCGKHVLATTWLEEFEQVLHRAVQKARTAYGHPGPLFERDPNLRRSVEGLIKLYDAGNEPGKAAEWRKKVAAE